MKLLNGKFVSSLIKEELIKKINDLSKNNIIPGLAIILVGDNPESKKYIEIKKKICLEIGVNFNLLHFEEEVKSEEIIENIEKLNNDDNTHGIIIQLPLPKNINQQNILNKVSVDKDVDGFHELNAGKLFLNRGVDLCPCTPLGCMELIDHYGIDIEGLDICIIGCSNIVGLPLSLILLRRNATVTLCHKYTKDLKEKTLQSDMVISCCGVPNIVTEDMVKENVIIIDIGINFVNEKLVGDVDFNGVKDKCSYITPVPGGIGPMTVVVLMKQTIESAERLNKL